MFSITIQGGSIEELLGNLKKVLVSTENSKPDIPLAATATPPILVDPPVMPVGVTTAPPVSSNGSTFDPMLNLVAPYINTAPVADAPTYTLDQLAHAGAALAQAGKMDQAVALMTKYGVQSITQLQPAQYGSFATELRALGAQI